MLVGFSVFKSGSYDVLWGFMVFFVGFANCWWLFGNSCLFDGPFGDYFVFFLRFLSKSKNPRELFVGVQLVVLMRQSKESERWRSFFFPHRSIFLTNGVD